MNRVQKEKNVDQMHDKLMKSKVGVIADFTGVDVPSMNRLRKNCRNNKIDLMVVKKTLFKRAYKDTQFEAFADRLDGPTSIALAEEDPVSLSKTLVDFQATNENLKLKAAVFMGRVLGEQEIKQTAMLPSREVMLSMVLSALQSPYRKLVYSLNGIITKFANVLHQIKEKKEKETN